MPNAYKSGANINAICDGYTLLGSASQRGHLDVVKILVTEGAKIEATGTPNRATPLFIAAKMGRDDIVGFLLNAGANINATCSDTDGIIKTPLHIANENGHYKTACRIRKYMAPAFESRLNAIG